MYFDRGLSGIDLVSLAKKAAEISENKVSFSSIGIYVNPLQSRERRQEVETCIDCAWFGQHYCNHRFPGFGDSDWTRIMGKLKESGFEGDIVIEGFHDPEYRGEREMEGQLLALDYLKKCRKMSDKI